MSVFGARIVGAYQMLDAEFADGFNYTPMREVVNALPEPDPEREGGSIKAILLQPGAALGSGHSLNAMHKRASSEPKLSFMARGLLTDVRRFDRFTLTGSRHNPDRTGTRTYEVGDGPTPVGFGRYEATLVEISGIDVPPAPDDATPPW
jgi:hypothetical protein